MKSTWQARAAAYCRRLKGVPRKLKHYRCCRGSGCYARQSLARELWQYVRPPQCKVCGKREWYIDLARTKEHIERTGVFDTCDCGELPHPHRKASTVWCRGHPVGPSEEDHRERHGG